MKPILFILKMPFEDGSGQTWFCSQCAMLEGALMVNPHWEDHVDVRRIGYSRPRAEVVKVLGEENQWLPVLAIGEGKMITDPIEITKHLSQQYGGAAPHP